MFQTPKRNTDLRHVDSGLTEAEKKQVAQDVARARQKEKLGERYLLHPRHAPQRGTYNPITGARLA
ncbi:hypothetical protein [Trinickia sp.]|uniref:hypothetical protein n=1 Tax=Trinickia sp. TaxID=2571163 RepID=UPI003F8083CC